MNIVALKFGNGLKFQYDEYLFRYHTHFMVIVPEPNFHLFIYLVESVVSIGNTLAYCNLAFQSLAQKLTRVCCNFPSRSGVHPVSRY